MDITWAAGARLLEVTGENAGCYAAPKLIDGVLCAVQQFTTTYGLVVGISEVGYQCRYCYKTAVEAILELEKYENLTEHPGGMWIKCKGRFHGQLVDLLNPKFCKEEESDEPN